MGMKMELNKALCCLLATIGLVILPVLSTTTNSPEGPPTVQYVAPERFSTIGVDVDLPCEATANPAITSVTWRKYITEFSTETLEIDDVKYSGGEATQLALTIISPFLNDSGRFFCEVANSHGVVYGQVLTLLVTEETGLPIVTISQLFYTVTTGDDVTLGCTVVSNPVLYAIEWRRNGNQIFIDDTKYFGGTNTSPDLLIKSILSNEGGNYACEATNSFGSVLETTVVTVVNVTTGPPNITLPLTSYTPTEGDNVTFVCNIVSSPSLYNVTWYLNGVEVNVDGSTVTGSTPSEPSLTVLGIQFWFSGTLTCHGANSVASASKSLVVNVLPVTSTEQQTTTNATTNTTNTTTTTTAGQQTTTKELITTEQQTTEAATTLEQQTTEEITTTDQQTTEEPTTLEQQTTEEITTTDQQTTEEPTTLEQQTTEEETTTKQQTEEIPTTEQQTTTEALTTTEQQTTTEAPTTTEQQITEAVTTTEQQTTTEAPTTTEQQTTTEAPTTTEQQTTTEAPTTTEQQTTEEDTTTEQQTTEEETTTKQQTEEITTTEQQTTEEDTTIEQQTTTEAPTTTEQQTTTEAPTTTEQQTTEEDTTTEQQTTTEAPTTTEQQTTTEAVTTTEQQITTEAPTTTTTQKTTTTTTTTPPPTTAPIAVITAKPQVDGRLVTLNNNANDSTTVGGVTNSISSTLNVLNTLDQDKDVSTQLELVAEIMENNVRVASSLNTSAEQNKNVAEEILKLTDRVSTLSHNCTGTCTVASVSFTKAETSTFAVIQSVLDTEGEFNKSHSNIHANGKSDKGNDLPSTLSTDIGDVTLPVWGTLQKTLAEEEVKLVVLMYNDNPYQTRSSNVTINTGVVSFGMFHNNNTPVAYVDQEDPMAVSIPENTVSGPDGSQTAAAQWANAQELRSEKGSYLTAVTFTPEQSAANVLLQLPDTGNCVVYGRKHGKKPSASQYDFYVRTKGRNRVTKYRPYGLQHSFHDGVLSLSVEGGIHTGTLVPLTQCQGAVSSNIVKRNAPQTLTQRVVGVDLRYFDQVSLTWAKNPGLKIKSGQTGRVNFESNFFGSFSASTLLIPPSPIAFEEIFLNFEERLASTPHVLVTIIAVLLLFLLLSFLLRRLDRKDAELWDYLPLIDNKPGTIFMYYFAVSTGLRSSKHLTATVYINIIGEFGESGPRILLDGRRQNFRRGTTSHFLMTTENYLGPLQSVQIWHDNVGTSPRWMLSKIIVCDGMDNERYVFGCGKWLSMDTDDALTFRTLHMIDEALVDMDAVFVDVSTRYMFDDNLWFSLPKRPSYSRFTRVQRLWLLAAILFLSMITSAMFFRSSGDEGRSVTIGPIRLNYKQIYVGFMSFFITILPSLAVVYIFKYRRCKNEMVRPNRYQKSKENHLPWWVIFIAYGLILLSITAAAFFTMLYSLEWGPDTTLDWMMSFFIGIIQSVFIMEPCKAACMAIVMTMLCTGAAQRTMTEIPSSDNIQVTYDNWYLDTSDVVSPKLEDTQKADLDQRRRRCRLDKRLNSVVLGWLSHLLYILVVAVICSHNHTTRAYRQNVALGKKVNSDQSLKTVEEVWKWLETSLVDQLFPFKYYNDDVMTSYVQQSADQFYRLGLVRLRQTRVRGSCDIPSTIRPWVNKCVPEMTSDSEDRTSYCINWATYHTSCFDEVDEDHYAYTYKTASETESLYHIGMVGDYEGGGYVRDIGPTHELARNNIDRLREQTWIDDKTRALFVDAVFLNGDTMLFSHVKVVFEFAPFGGVVTTFRSTTSNLYPYVGSLDYLVLIFQIIFIVIVCVRIVLGIASVIKTKCSCLTCLSTWIGLLEIALSVAAISVYILRIDRTIEAIERIFNDIGFFVSFEMVEILDILYRTFIGSLCFIAILNLLNPLSFNYYLHLMKTTISMFRAEAVQFSVIAFLFIIAFSCIIYLIFGYSEPGFKDFKTTFLYLFRIMIGMIHFREILVKETIGITLILGLYITIATILTINFFLAGLNFVFTEARNKSAVKGEYQFDAEINEHFWWKMSAVASKVLGKTETVQKKRKLSFGGLTEAKVESLLEELDFLLASVTDWMLVSENEEVRVEVQQLAHINRWYNNQPDIVELECFRSDTRTSTEFVYGDRFGQLVFKLSCVSLEQDDRVFGAIMSVMTSKSNHIYPCGQASQPCSGVIVLTKASTNTRMGAVSVAIASKSEQRYGESDLPLFIASSYDGGTSWQMTAAWRKVVENQPCICCDLTSCPTHVVGVACDQWPYLPIRLRGHWESWTLDRSSHTLHSVVHSQLSISIDAGSIKDRASVFLILEPTDFLPTIHFLSTETFIKPITVRFSCKDIDADTPYKVFVLMQDGDLRWSRQCIIDIMPKLPKFEIDVQNIRKGVRRAIAVVPSDLDSSSKSLFGVKCYNGMINYSSHRLVNDLLNSSSIDINL